MAHMSIFTDSGPFYLIDNDRGESTFLPADVVGDIGLEIGAECSEDSEGVTAERWAKIASVLREFIEGEPYAVALRDCWGARYSAPGYLNCTEWSIGATEKEAIAACKKVYGGEDIECPECGTEFKENDGFETADDEVCCSEDCAVRHEIAEGLREPAEPEEGDLTTENHRVFWSRGKVAFAVGEDEDWRQAAREWMDREQFWPNVWLISDHGNAHLLSMSEEPSK